MCELTMFGIVPFLVDISEFLFQWHVKSFGSVYFIRRTTPRCLELAAQSVRFHQVDQLRCVAMKG